MIITVDAKQLNSEGGFHETRIWPLDLVSGLAVETRHSFYDGTAARSRHTKFAFGFDLGGDRLRAASVAQRFQSPLVQDAAVFDAFNMIRDHLTRLAVPSPLTSSS